MLLQEKSKAHELPTRREEEHTHVICGFMNTQRKTYNKATNSGLWVIRQEALKA